MTSRSAERLGCVVIIDYLFDHAMHTLNPPHLCAEPTTYQSLGQLVGIGLGRITVL